jgi:hypothetical protein
MSNTTVQVPLDEYLDNIEPDDLEEAIEILKKRYNEWQNWLSMPV